VETPEQLKILQAEGCPILQGFLFSRPKPAAHIAAMLAGASLLPEEARVAGAEEKVRA
jgi:EAL domain-containing protein (putative c-di-GMP-specific phosphodiesterase class I)